MRANELVTDEIPPLKPTDSPSRALAWMDELKVSHLAIVDDSNYIGIISDSELLDLNMPEKPIGEQKNAFLRPFAKEAQHVYEVMQLMHSLQISVLPVLDEEENYLGVITVNKVFDNFASMASVAEPGGVIVLEMNTHDYTLAEISRIVESNDAKILSMFVSSVVNSTEVEVTLKLNRQDLSGVLQTFERFNYQIKASFHQSEFDDDLKNRYDSFMNYINI
jgi:predicted transcriptional regulator